jgi:benzoate-CoA ligase
MKTSFSWGDRDLRAIRSPEDLPERFNFAVALLDRHLAEGRGAQMALWGPAGNYTYEQLCRFANQTGNALRSLGLAPEQRVLLLLRDSPELIATYLGAMKIGAVPVALNTFAHPADYEFYLRNSQARLLVGEAEFLAPLEPLLRRTPSLRGVISVRGEGVSGAARFEQAVAAQPGELDPYPTHRDQPAYWVYTSGSTGESKAAVHLHRNTIFAVEPFLRHVARLTPQDINFSVARLFFSYGLVNSLFMPLWAGAGVALLPDRPEPDTILAMIEQYRPTLFFSVPTAYGRMLREGFDTQKLASLRLCVSAGEALPAPIYHRWKEKTGLEIIDGVGSTEFGYIFLANRPGQVIPGSSGTVFPEHKFRLVDPAGSDARPGEMGELWMASHSIASYYFRNHEASKKTFLGEWLRTNDQYELSEGGVLTYQGRSDDLFKSGGIWVSPIQVESTLLAHPSVAEASVVAERDGQGLEKPIAYVVLKSGHSPDDGMAQELRNFTRERLAVYKCPKSFHFVSELPKTASGKIQRFKLRQRASAAEQPQAEQAL